ADDSFRVREKASADLIAVGPGALPQLRAALKHDDPEVSLRARDAIAAIDPNSAAPVVAVIVRPLRGQPQEAMLPVLIDYLGYADDDEVREEITQTLLRHAVKDGRVDALMPPLLTDGSANRRGAAALVLGRHGGDAHRAGVRALLKDPDVWVRY